MSSVHVDLAHEVIDVKKRRRRSFIPAIIRWMLLALAITFLNLPVHPWIDSLLDDSVFQDWIGFPTPFYLVVRHNGHLAIEEWDQHGLFVSLLFNILLLTCSVWALRGGRKGHDFMKGYSLAALLALVLSFATYFGLRQKHSFHPVINVVFTAEEISVLYIYLAIYWCWLRVIRFVGDLLSSITKIVVRDKNLAGI